MTWLLVNSGELIHGPRLILGRECSASVIDDDVDDNLLIYPIRPYGTTINATQQ